MWKEKEIMFWAKIDCKCRFVDWDARQFHGACKHFSSKFGIHVKKKKRNSQSVCFCIIGPPRNYSSLVLIWMWDESSSQFSPPLACCKGKLSRTSFFFFLPSTRTGCRLIRSSINSSWDAVEIILKQTGTQLGAMLVYNFQVQAEPENGTAPWCVHRADALTAKRDVGGEQSWSYHCYLISLAFH